MVAAQFLRRRPDLRTPLRRRRVVFLSSRSSSAPQPQQQQENQNKPPQPPTLRPRLSPAADPVQPQAAGDARYTHACSGSIRSLPSLLWRPWKLRSLPAHGQGQGPQRPDHHGADASSISISTWPWAASPPCTGPLPFMPSTRRTHPRGNHRGPIRGARGAGLGPRLRIATPVLGYMAWKQENSGGESAWDRFSPRARGRHHRGRLRRCLGRRKLAHPPSHRHK